MIDIGKYMLAIKDGEAWRVTTKKGGTLGIIEWNAKWREHEFVPEFVTAYTHDCLTALGQFVAEQNAKRKGSR